MDNQRASSEHTRVNQVTAQALSQWDSRSMRLDWLPCSHLPVLPTFATRIENFETRQTKMRRSATINPLWETPCTLPKKYKQEKLKKKNHSRPTSNGTKTTSSTCRYTDSAHPSMIRGEFWVSWLEHQPENDLSNCSNLQLVG